MCVHVCEHACVADCILTVGDVYLVGLNILDDDELMLNVLRCQLTY